MTIDLEALYAAASRAARPAAIGACERQVEQALATTTDPVVRGRALMCRARLRSNQWHTAEVVAAARSATELFEEAVTAAQLAVKLDEDSGDGHELMVALEALSASEAAAGETAIALATTLERAGCEVELAGDGVLALEALDRARFDDVLMDYQMPVIDGYEATRALRARESGADHLSVIAITAHAMEGAAAECLAAGMDDYLSKPLRREQLEAALHRWIASEPDSAAV